MKDKTHPHTNNLQKFWDAPNDALFGQSILSDVVGYSSAWFEWKRHAGGGIPYQKIGRKCLYRKTDVMNWLNQHQHVTSTSEYHSRSRS